MFDVGLQIAERDHTAAQRGGYRTGGSQNLFEQLRQILKHGLFFLGARAIGEKKLPVQVQCLPLYDSGIKPVIYRSQELISYT